MAAPIPPSPSDDKPSFDLNLQHGHKDLVQAVAFNTYGDRCATGSVDGKVRVFNRHRDGSWRLCDTWGAHGGEVIEVRHWGEMAAIANSLNTHMRLQTVFVWWT